MILVLDTETTGLPKNYHAPLTDFDNWPRAVQISWALYMSNGVLIREANFIIRPDGYEIPAEATKKHGITTEMALRDGADIVAVLKALTDDVLNAKLVVAHNMDFDENILGSEFLRAHLDDCLQIFDCSNKVCTMQSSTEFCELVGNYAGQFKWPKLSELHQILFNEKIEGEHNAAVDVRACARCFFGLANRGVIKFDQTYMDEQEIEQRRLELEASLTEQQAIADITANDPGLDELADQIDEETEADFDLTLLTPLHIASEIASAYRFQRVARHGLFETAHSLDLQKRALIRAQQAMRSTDAYKALTNDKARDAYVAENTEPFISLRDAAEDELAEARMHFEDASAEVEQARAMLRIAELAANIERVA